MIGKTRSRRDRIISTDCYQEHGQFLRAQFGDIYNALGAVSDEFTERLDTLNLQWAKAFLDKMS